MSDIYNNLENMSDAVVLNGVGAVRCHGLSLYAWIARMDYINEGGIVFSKGNQTHLKIAPDAPCYVEDRALGRISTGAKAADGHYVLNAHLKSSPRWLGRSEHGYALPEYEPKTIKCGSCGVVHARHSTPCKCIYLSPVLILDDICVVSLRIYRRRRDDYSRSSRELLLQGMFEPVLPTLSSFEPTMNYESSAKISEDGQNPEFPESS